MTKTYKIVLVDDETQVRSRIEAKLKDMQDFTIVGSVKNGYDALDVIEIHDVDIVITDISMPYMDGIELTKIIRRDYPKIKVVFITGYDEFDYAKEAVDLSVIKYLMKPVTKDDIDVLMKELKTQLNAEYETMYNEQKLTKTYQKSLPLLIENQFNALLHLESLDDSVFEKFSVFNIDLKQGDFVVAIVQFSGEKDYQKLEKARVFSVNLFKKIMSRFEQTYRFYTMSGIAFIIHHSNLDKREVENSLNEFRQRSNDKLTSAFKIGVSSIFDNFKLFNKKYSEAKEALSYVHYLNAGDVLFYTDIVTKDTYNLFLDKDELARIEYIIKFENQATIKHLFGEMKHSINKVNHTLINQEQYRINLMQVVLNFANFLNVDTKNVFVKSTLTQTLEIGKLEAFIDTIYEKIIYLKSQHETNTKLVSDDLINNIVAYVDTNYTNPDLSLDFMCDKFNISVSYFSVLFKKKTATTFNKYLVKKRMQRAQELLIYTSKKILEIASDVGYHEVYHFSHSFKKYCGLAPKEYRDDETSQ